MRAQPSRDDLSRFLVHLTRDYNGQSARSNLVSVLRQKKIFARNAHCLFMHKIDRMECSKVLKGKFKTVCFTEVPLTQIKRIVRPMSDRKIKLKPYGIVFWKDHLFEMGASPSIYINANGTSLSDYLNDQFDYHFRDVKSFRALQQVEKDYHEEIVHYYSLINVVRDDHDFMWEREWRYNGDLTFRYRDVAAVIAKDPDDFRAYCDDVLEPGVAVWIRRLPVIDPGWGYEELVEEMALKIWESRPIQRSHPSHSGS
jgi:hypothetical protein